jgi:hypothetical protein
MVEPKKKVELAGTTQLVDGIESKIYSVRGSRIMFSHDLAELYGIETKVLLQAVRRNLDRFPADFQFSLTNQEFTILRSQTVTSSWGGLGTRIRDLMTPPELPKKRRIGFIQE